MSTTTTSPSSMTRSLTEWCGLAPLGPDADDDEFGCGVALLDDRRGDVGSDVRLGATGPEPLADPGVDAVDRRAGRPQLGELGRVLAHPQLAQDRAGELLVGGAGITQPQQVQGRGHVGHRDADRAARRRAPAA